MEDDGGESGFGGGDTGLASGSANKSNGFSGRNEIVEMKREEEEEEEEEIQPAEDYIYVAVGKSNSGMDALRWTLNHLLKPSSLVFLIHVFPEVRHIPTPLGKLPKEQVNPEQVENYMNQERRKIRQLLQKYLDLCNASMVNVDTILIESDFIAKAVIDLIPILNITKLVVGKSSRRGSGVEDQIKKNAPVFCDVKIICEGKEVTREQTESPTSPSLRGGDITTTPTTLELEDQRDTSVSCACFTRKFI
uniref:U-box domain-containing protein 35-like n=1 Tax=Nelumbo nucifera TaxID=4432 RepID=A0A822XQH9_NELNU|nr:TPA_asm: hypothetical protein HUJ06_025327 [Nelumbo nucifera]